MAVERTIICASPRPQGACAAATREAARLLAAAGEPAPRTLFLHELEVAPCIGCDRCKRLGRCFMRDSMDAVIAALDASDELFIASPVYFAGPPAGYKALLDRLQPYFWTFERGGARRPVRLLVSGAGGDPHGFDPLVVCTRSALAVAGFRLESVVPCIGTGAAGARAAVPRWLGRASSEEEGNPSDGR
jgi:NAD(P)H-dependent FMN reductase